MTDMEFDMGLTGSIARTIDGQTRLCNLVAEGLRVRAKERQTEGRPDIAGRLRYLAGKIDSHGKPTKKVLSKLNKDIGIVKARMVDDKPIADWESIPRHVH